MISWGIVNSLNWRSKNHNPNSKMKFKPFDRCIFSKKKRNNPLQISLSKLTLLENNDLKTTLCLQFRKMLQKNCVKLCYKCAYNYLEIFHRGAKKFLVRQIHAVYKII